ncbi:MAG TPA: FtsX-like permease family protein [Steroidobacteraceae bacterium]
MNWNIRPTLSAILRNKTGPLLVALQIAIALAVVVNAVYILEQRIEKMNRPTGVDDRNLFEISASGFTPRYDGVAALHEDLTYLRSLPGVIDATSAATVPMGSSNQSTGLYTTPSATGPARPVSIYSVDEHALNTLGAHLLAGRNFRTEEVLPPQKNLNVTERIPEVIITQSVARWLFPHENALGRVVYLAPGEPSTIIGIMNDVIATAWASTHFGAYDDALIPRPSVVYGSGYLVRTAPGQRDRLMRVAAQHLAASNPNRVVNQVRSLEDLRQRLYRTDLNMTIFLSIVTVLLIGVACFGVFALATFNVSTRIKQIGTRRAIGARRADIVRYFLVENALITTAGVVIGCALALGAGYWLSVRLELPRLDLYYLVGGVLVLWGISQLAAWHPARRAATVPPSVATRTV